MLARIVLKLFLFALLVAALVQVAGIAWGLGVGFAIATVAWTYGNTRLFAMYRWLTSDGTRRVPGGRGVWDDVFSLLYRQQRAQAYQLNELSVSLERFRKAAQALPDGVVTLTRENQIIFCNDVAAGMFGLDTQADVGRAITNLVRAPEFSAYLKASDWAKPIVLRVAHADPCVLQVQLIEYGDGQRLMLSRDITQLERLETMRRDFHANVSHELKTPLTVLAGFLETLSDHPDMPQEQQHHFIDVMNEQATRMRRIVQDLLTLSALEAKPVSHRDAVVELDPIMQRLENSASVLSGGRHRIAFDITPELALYGAETELGSAFENLISNAVRYTPDGGSIDVRLGVAVDLGDPSIRFSVTDTGIGIEAQHIPRLTERFYRVDRSRSRDSGGTGLGLAIVKHVLTRHEAALRIESDYGHGTTMTAVFPARRIAKTKRAAVSA